MKSFFICIENGDQEFMRLFRAESLPRIGEMVKVGGSYGEVTCIWHDLEKGNFPMVDLDLTGVDFESALKVGHWQPIM